MTSAADLPAVPSPAGDNPISKRQQLARFVADHNPFYVLSAMCMLAGLFILNDSLDWSPIPGGKLLTLVATLNVYEWLLIGLAALLFKRGVRRDGTILLLLEVFFLADVAFLNAELFTASLGAKASISGAAASYANLALFLTAAAKLYVAFRAAGLSLSPSAPSERNAIHLFGFTLLTIATTFALPGLFTVYFRHHNDVVAPGVLYAAWWAIGLLPAIFVLLTPSSRIFGYASWMRALPVLRAYVLIPFLSLVAHVAMAHWIYKTPFFSDNLAPLALGLAVFLGRFDRHEFTRALRWRSQLVLPALAVLLCLSPAPELTASVGHFHLTALRLVGAGVVLVYLDGGFAHRKPIFFAGAATCVTGGALGGSPESILTNLAEVFRRIGYALGLLVPRTAKHWGIVSVVASFALLAMGAWVSLGKRPAPQQEQA